MICDHSSYNLIPYAFLSKENDKNTQLPKDKKKEQEDKELDEELKETFPASDPGQHNGHA